MTNATGYKMFNLIVRVDGETMFFRGLVACDLESAVADVVAAYGEAELVQWGLA